MRRQAGTAETERRPFLGRLARDVRGNTLAIMAAAMIPLIGFSGSAIDMARLYVVKVRLQQACDAGVLAGRRTLTDTAPSTQLDAAANTQAQQFFASNFKSGWFQNAAAHFYPVKATVGTSTVANAVTANAEATVPMALMRFFGKPDVKLTVKCQALYDLADADVMFVLDTTGSMSCYPTDPTTCSTTPTPYPRGDGSTGYRAPEKAPTTTADGKPLYSKIESLRQAVVTFDSIMRANADPSTHIRYGFVPYSSAVNVGRSLPSEYLQNTSWTYQSRHVIGDYNYGASFTQSINLSQSQCPVGKTVRMPTAPDYLRSNSGLWNDEGYYQARVYSNITYASGVCSATGQRVRPLWRYEPVSWNISSYVAGNAVTNPSRLDGATSKWNGCVEELNTSASAAFNVNSLPDDLNPDVAPTDPTNKWRPAWQDVMWLRDPGTGSMDVRDDQVDENNINQYIDYNYRAAGQLDRGGSAACGMPAQGLRSMTSQAVRNYVYNADFQPMGGTYHDVGMIWGTRMLSPDGIFKADTAPWPGRNPPTRTIVLMTDGTLAPSQTSYGQYGVEMFDNRVGSNRDGNEQLARHAARLRIECDAAKKKGFTVYTVALGLHGAAVPDLDYCSSTGKVFYADDTQSLNDVFSTIALRVAKLRINQ